MARLPLCNVLIAFEFSARHGTSSQSAEALPVIPAALSQRLRLLEGRMHIQLLHGATPATGFLGALGSVHVRTVIKRSTKPVFFQENDSTGRVTTNELVQSIFSILASIIQIQAPR